MEPGFVEYLWISVFGSILPEPLGVGKGAEEQKRYEIAKTGLGLF